MSWRNAHLSKWAHTSYPFHLPISFKLFCNVFLIRYLIHKLRKHIFRLLIDVSQMEASYHRHDISDEVWTLLEPHLPGQRGQWGGIAQDNRRFINAVFWVLRLEDADDQFRLQPPLQFRVEVLARAAMLVIEQAVLLRRHKQQHCREKPQ